MSNDVRFVSLCVGTRLMKKRRDEWGKREKRIGKMQKKYMKDVFKRHC